RLHEYQPPKEGRAEKVRLDFNENTVGCPPGVALALRRAMKPDWFTLYPEYEEARSRLARYFRVAPEELLITNGVDDAIKLICDTFVEAGDVLVTPTPTFAIYQFFHEVAGGAVRLVHYDQDLQLSPERFLQSIDRRVRWVALANPNNPTGALMPKAHLKVILEGARDTLILVDEAYFDFSGVTILPWIRKYPNLIVSRTFSKAFGLAALRIGFMFAHKRLAGLMKRVHAAYAVNGVAVRAAVEAIRHQGYIRQYAGMIVKNRDDFCRRLESWGIPHAPTEANFVLVRVGARAREIARRLRRRGVLVRDWSDNPRLGSYLRITIGDASQMRRLSAELARLRFMVETVNGAAAWRDLTASLPIGWSA
ncbi:MAG TPA: histidinol-phosphate transaminase, partial [Terriglobia bacterium]|nr:histidinol-phosphate transaminase [Terriglobia bacterium]